MAGRFDIIVVADPRFPGGTSTALAADLRVAVAAGYGVGLLALKGPLLRFPHPLHPEIADLVTKGSVSLVDPDDAIEASLAIAHHPQIFEHLPVRPLRVRAETRLLVVHHPPHDAEGAPFYDPARIGTVAETVLGGPVCWAPVGPQVRLQLLGLAAPPPLHDTDWVSVLEHERFEVERKADGGRLQMLAIGRHSRPDPLKWPADRETLLQTLPDEPWLRVQILGGAPFLEQLVAPKPPNWTILPFGAREVGRFLAGLDAYVYFHHPRWVEAFGRNVLEALAAGCLAILPSSFAPLFGEAALYGDPGGVRSQLELLRSDPIRREEMRSAARELVRTRFAPRRREDQIRALAGPPRGSRPSPKALRPRRVMFITSNGIGLGHLTRCLAIARRLPSPLEPVIVTMSRAIALVRSMNIPCEFLPFHRHLGADQGRWNHFLRLELDELLQTYDPAVVVFDGNMPYGGLLGALDAHDAWKIWMRRAMWREGASSTAFEREGAFDVVIEPGELAGLLDRGPTRHYTGRTRAVGPILLYDPGEAFEQAVARELLKLPADQTCILLQLGSGNNYDYISALTVCLERLRRANALVVAVRSPIADHPWDFPEEVRSLARYPLAPYLRAFDGAIAAAGYNSFHELLFSGTPTLFLPNEHPMMDDQLGRALYAERAGLGLCARTTRPAELRRGLDRLLDPDCRADTRRFLELLPRPEGGRMAATMVHEMTRFRRADRGP